MNIVWVCIYPHVNVQTNTGVCIEWLLGWSVRWWELVVFHGGGGIDSPEYHISNFIAAISENLSGKGCKHDWRAMVDLGIDKGAMAPSIYYYFIFIFIILNTFFFKFNIFNIFYILIKFYTFI